MGSGEAESTPTRLALSGLCLLVAFLNLGLPLAQSFSGRCTSGLSGIFCRSRRFATSRHWADELGVNGIRAVQRNLPTQREHVSGLLMQETKGVLTPAYNHQNRSPKIGLPTWHAHVT